MAHLKKSLEGAYINAKCQFIIIIEPKLKTKGLRRIHSDDSDWPLQIWIKKGIFIYNFRLKGILIQANGPFHTT